MYHKKWPLCLARNYFCDLAPSRKKATFGSLEGWDKDTGSPGPLSHSRLHLLHFSLVHFPALRVSACKTIKLDGESAASAIKMVSCDSAPMIRHSHAQPKIDRARQELMPPKTCSVFLALDQKPKPAAVLLYSPNRTTCLQRRILHCGSAVLNDNGPAREALQIRERL